jgi:S-formylglutathione hydrolase
MSTTFETTGTIASFGGKLLKLKHKATTTNCDMALNLYLPPQAKPGKKVPVLFYLSGLTCTGDNCAEKGFFQHKAAEKGLAIVYPDTSPRGLKIEGEDDAYDFGSGAGFYVDATKKPYDKGYNMYSYITEELPKALFGAFEELDESRVGITGHSMGGHGALTLVSKILFEFAFILPSILAVFICSLPYLPRWTIPLTRHSPNVVLQEPNSLQIRLRLRTNRKPDKLPMGPEGVLRLLWRG